MELFCTLISFLEYPRNTLSLVSRICRRILHNWYALGSHKNQSDIYYWCHHRRPTNISIIRRQMMISPDLVDMRGYHQMCSVSFACIMRHEYTQFLSSFFFCFLSFFCSIRYHFVIYSAPITIQIVIIYQFKWWIKLVLES